MLNSDTKAVDMMTQWSLASSQQDVIDALNNIRKLQMAQRGFTGSDASANITSDSSAAGTTQNGVNELHSADVNGTVDKDMVAANVAFCTTHLSAIIPGFADILPADTPWLEKQVKRNQVWILYDASIARACIRTNTVVSEGNRDVTEQENANDSCSPQPKNAVAVLVLAYNAEGRRYIQGEFLQ